MNPEIIGRWAVNGAGTIGKINAIVGHQYVGLTLTGQAWSSMAPLPLNMDYDRMFEAARA